MRKKIVAGNWKMNKDMAEGMALAQEFMQQTITSDATVVLNPPFIHLSELRKLIPSEGNIFLGAQNCYSEVSGAYTGEVSVSMLKSIPVDYTIIGHSERREYFQESNEQLAKKVDLLLGVEIIPIFCCGESLATREAGDHVAFVSQQITESLFHLAAAAFAKLVIAYEPIWAIGTGKTASAAQAQEMHAAIRQHVAEKYGQEIADNLSILYGGSVKPANAAELFAEADVDGGLVGGASLKPADFAAIVNAM